MRTHARLLNCCALPKAVLHAGLLLVLICLAMPCRAEDPRAESARYFGMGNAAFDRGSHAEAERMFRVCIALSPDLAGPYRRLGQTLKMLDRCEEAIDHFLSYLRKRPKGKFSDAIRKELAECSVEVKARRGSKPTRQVASGVLRLQVNLDHAQVKVDGLEMGSSPLPRLTLKAGVHRLEVSHPDHFTAIKTFDLSGGADIELAIALQAKPVEPEPPPRVQLAPLTLDVRPGGARIILDDKLVGLAPIRSLALDPGTHILKVIKPGFLPEEHRLVAEEGVPMKLEVRLMRMEGEWALDSLSTGKQEGRADRPDEGPATSSDTTSPTPEGGQRWLALGTLGTGGACVLGGLVLGSLAMSKSASYDEADENSDRRHLKEDGEAMALGADILLVSGAALAAGGAAMYLLRGRDSARTAAERRGQGGSSLLSELRPLAMPGFLGIEGRF